MPASDGSSPLMQTLRSRRVSGTTSLGALGLVSLALLTACSSSSGGTSAAAAPTAAPSGAASGANGAAGARQGGPAASGLIAAADGSTLQVQSQQNGQVAVNWTASTTFTQQVTVAAASLEAGECVTASATTGDSSSTSFTATTIRVTQATNGDCTGGFGGGAGGGTRPSGAPTGGGMPGGGTFPSGGAMPSGAPGGTTRTGTFASGKVVSVSGSTVVVAARQFGGASASASSTPTTVNETITIGSTTKITAQEKATSAAATVGRCATAQGTADSTGAVAATSVSVTDAVDGACTTGFGGFGGAPAAAASGSTNG